VQPVSKLPLADKVPVCAGARLHTLNRRPVSSIRIGAKPVGFFLLAYQEMDEPDTAPACPTRALCGSRPERPRFLPSRRALAQRLRLHRARYFRSTRSQNAQSVGSPSSTRTWLWTIAEKTTWPARRRAAAWNRCSRTSGPGRVGLAR